MQGFRRSLVFAVITLSLASACAGGTGGGGGGSGPLTTVRLQLQWVAQSQFAGYYAAAAKGDYNDADLDGEVDAAQAMIYNEYAQVLEQKNPKTGKLYQPDELNVIDFNKVGTAMLQDHLFARDAWLKKSGNEDIATRFLQASFKGWVFCRDSQKECVDIVLKAGTTLGKGHMTWQLNEINALIWPSPSGIGAIEKASWDQTVCISTTYQILKGAPSGTP